MRLSGTKLIIGIPLTIGINERLTYDYKRDNTLYMKSFEDLQALEELERELDREITECEVMSALESQVIKVRRLANHSP